MAALRGPGVVVGLPPGKTAAQSHRPKTVAVFVKTSRPSCLIEKGYRGMARLGIHCLTIEVTQGSEEDFEILLNMFLQLEGVKFAVDLFESMLGQRGQLG